MIIREQPDVGAGIARQWIDADHVDAIVDVPTSVGSLWPVEDVTREEADLSDVGISLF